ncbi:MAG TPA: hypothetical protein VF902_06140 [Coriobacteriia bacterium]
MLGAVRMWSIGTGALALMLVAAAAALPAVASAQVVTAPYAVPATVAATSGPGGVPSKIVTATPLGTWALDFTLPTFGKSGCLVCHGDPLLIVPKGDTIQSFWIDQIAYDRSAHGTVECAGCHLDFGYRAPHDPGADWRSIAKQGCVNCHNAQFLDFAAGSHAARPGVNKQPDPNAASKPMCGDCHGAHDIPRLTKSVGASKTPDPAGKALVHGQSEQMCGSAKGCHQDYWDSYSDYYHGAAYKRGALDAPACWDCHGTHMVRPTTDTLSPTSIKNLPATCGNGADGSLIGACHEGSSPELAQYAPLIHKRAATLSANPLYAFFQKVRAWFE